MFRACLGFVFVFMFMAASVFSQTNSEKASQVPALIQEPPTTKSQDSTQAADSAKAAAKDKSKSKAKAAKASEKAAKKADAKALADSVRAAKAAPVAVDSSKSAPAAPSIAADSARPMDARPMDARPLDTAQAAAPSSPAAPAAPSAPSGDSVPVPTVEAAAPAPSQILTEPPQRLPPDLRLFNDPPLIAKEYGFGILGSVAAGALGFYIGSGIETALEGESRAHQGTLSFTGIRYDNFYGAFYGGATGMILGSALTTYFVGQTDEEDGGFLMTFLGTAAAAGGAFYVAHLMGVNDDVDWKPFLPLVAIPSLGGTLGFNVSRWWSDHKREATVGRESKGAALRLHAPRIAWGRDAGGDRLEVRALNLTF